VVWTQVVRAGPPADAILELAGSDPATGVALATHGRSGIGRLLKVSVADEVIRKALGPVLVFHPPGG
jgi:nucleotide-binding universal stress UspA family protein